MLRRWLKCCPGKSMPKYTQKYLATFRKALLTLLHSGPIDPYYGVCQNLDTLVRKPGYSGYAFVTDEAVNWPHALKYEDGMLCPYFVPDTPELWAGEGLELRKDLIQYLLGRVAHHEELLKTE